MADSVPTSWGRIPRVEHTRVRELKWVHESFPALDPDELTLPYGLGRSYGDSCLNEHGSLLRTAKLDRFVHFDQDRGILTCESGVSLAKILTLIVPHGWFLPVTPGTKFVTVGGAIANDIHGKNHHRSGTFGHHLLNFELLRSDGNRIRCSPDENEDWFRATVGGLGLTGLITTASFQLKPINNEFIDAERIKLRHLDDFWHWAELSDERYEYTVAWIDCLARGDNLGRGIFIRGNHAPPVNHSRLPRPGKTRNLPFNMPGFLLNKHSIGAFNNLYYRKQVRKHIRHLEHYESFFYPLDAILNWNRLYGKKGFFQYQCVVPYEHSRDPIRSILETVADSRQASFLAVLKVFGDINSWGRLSFPRPGVTLCLDFPNNGTETLALFKRLDAITASAGGCVYPAKDACMSADMFQAFFPNWKGMLPFIDPRFSSSFWRRVTPRNQPVADIIPASAVTKLPPLS